MKFDDAKAASAWKQANAPALDKLVDYVHGLPDTLYTDQKFHHTTSATPSHIVGVDYDLKEYVCVPLSVIHREERMRVDVAMKVMERALLRLPENVRAEVLAKVSSALEKGELKLPAPKVAERAVDQPHQPSVPIMRG